MNKLFYTITALFCAVSVGKVFARTTPTQARSSDAAPRLVVAITIDQLRSDHLEAYRSDYGEGGFTLLAERGAIYGSASYPFAPVDRASAAAALSTGTSPYYNSIVGRQWLDRKTLRPVWCTYDERYPGLETRETASPEALGTSTLGDELKVGTDGWALVWSIAPTSDAAVLSAGHAANGALWKDKENGKWCSSQYYMKQMPHWVRTAADDSNITDMALRCIKATAMGRDEVCDLLCLTYSVGETVVASASEQANWQYNYVKIDGELKRLIAGVERLVGEGNVLFVVTATGYSEERREANYEQYRIPTGTFYMSRTADLLNMYLGAIWGQGKYVETTFRNHIFLNHDLLDKKKISITEATNRAQELLVMMDGVRNVYTSLQLLTISNEQIQRVRQGYHPERCGDLVIETTPGWQVLTENTGDSEMQRASYIQFPVIFYGADITPRRIDQPVTTDRIAPTLARIMRVRAPNACSAEPLF